MKKHSKLGKEIERARKERGWTITRLAEALGESEDFIKKLEEGDEATYLKIDSRWLSLCNDIAKALDMYLEVEPLFGCNKKYSKLSERKK